MSVAQNFKVIVALKSAKELKMGTVRCTIQLQDKVKFTVLPQSEGQFFDVNDLNISQPIIVIFDEEQSGLRIGEVRIPIPTTIYQEKEIELADQFTIEYDLEDGSSERFSGRYYIIILNKGTVKVEKPNDQFQDSLEDRAHQQLQVQHNQRATESPTKQFIKATGERTQERTNKQNSKKLLAETKYDPKSKKASTNKVVAPQKPTSTAKKGKETKVINKYDSQRSFDNGSKSQTVLKTLEQEGSSEKLRTPPRQVRQQSPFQKYRVGSQIKQSDYESEVEYWKGIVEELQHTCQRAEGNGEINSRINSDLQISENKRKDLQNLVREGIDEGVRIRDEIERRINELVQENTRLQKKVKTQTEKINQQEKDIDDRNTVISDQSLKIRQLEDKLQIIDELKRVCSVQQDKLEDQQVRFKEQQKSFDDEVQSLLHQITKLEGQYTHLLSQKGDVEMNLQDCIKQLQRWSELNKELEAKLQTAKIECDLKGSWEVTAQQLKIQNNELHVQILDVRHRNEQLTQLLDQLRKDLQNMELTKEDSTRSFLDKIGALKEVIRGQDVRQQDLESENKKLQKQVFLVFLMRKNQIFFQLQEQNNQLNVQAKQVEEFKKQVDQYKKEFGSLLQETQQLTATIEDLTDSLQTSNNQVIQQQFQYYSFKQILELRAEVLHGQKEKEDIEANSNNLKKLILEMRERGIAYIPMSNDKIDQLLAEFINSRQDSDKYRQLFVREGEGVYQFGTKKIYVKCEQDKILIRSGGGYISIEEFLNLFSQREMEAAQRSDPLAAIAKNRAVQRKMDSMKLVGKGRNDSYSPLGKKQSNI